MRILVIGSKGTLGAPLCKELRRRDHDVTECDLQHASGDYYRADIGEFRQIEHVLLLTEPDVVYLLAAEFGRLNGEHYYEQVWRTNVIGLRNILELQRHLGFDLVFTSSSEIYGELDEPLLREDLSEQIPLRQRNDYAISKYVNEQQILNAQEQHGSEVVRLRLFNAYGPGEHYHRYRSVVCLFCYSALHGIPYDIYSGYYRVFMYIDDLIPTMCNVAKNFIPGEVYNIGGKEYCSVKDLHEIVQKNLEPREKEKQDFTFLPEDVHNVKSKRPDNTKAIRDLGHNPRITLEEGVPNTLNWMREVYW